MQCDKDAKSKASKKLSNKQASKKLSNKLANQKLRDELARSLHKASYLLSRM